MSKRYIHSAKDSILVEDGSEQHKELIEGGEYFNDKSDVNYVQTVEGTVGEGEDDAGTAISNLSDEDLESLYEEVDAEMVKRELFEVPAGDGEAGDTINLETLTDSELKALGQKYKIPSSHLMKRETLIEALKGAANA